MYVYVHGGVVTVSVHNFEFVSYIKYESTYIIWLEYSSHLTFVDTQGEISIYLIGRSWLIPEGYFKYHDFYKMFLCWQLHVASSVPETHFDAAQRKRPELHRGVRAGRLQTQSLPQVQVHRLSGTKEIHYI